MVLQAVVAQAIAEREQEMITRVMSRTEESRVFSREAPVRLETFRADGQSCVAVGGDIDHMLRRLAGREIEFFEMAARNYRLIDQHFQRNGFEVDRAVSRRRRGRFHRGAEPPTGWQDDGRFDDNFRGVAALWQKSNEIPFEHGQL